VKTSRGICLFISVQEWSSPSFSFFLLSLFFIKLKLFLLFHRVMGNQGPCSHKESHAHSRKAEDVTVPTLLVNSLRSTVHLCFSLFSCSTRKVPAAHAVELLVVYNHGMVIIHHSGVNFINCYFTLTERFPQLWWVLVFQHNIYTCKYFAFPAIAKADFFFSCILLLLCSQKYFGGLVK